jgi:hypothetical protein
MDSRFRGNDKRQTHTGKLIPLNKNPPLSPFAKGGGRGIFLFWAVGCMLLALALWLGA